MAIVSEILTAIDSKVSSILPNYKKAKFNYILEANNRVGSKKIYAIRPSSGRSVIGVTMTATFDHDFEVILSDIYQVKNDSDADLGDRITQLHSDLELLYRDLYQKRLNLTSAQVLLVQLVDLSVPEIDNDNDSVSITATFTVKYRSNL
jgi:hypothetical protein